MSPTWLSLPSTLLKPIGPPEMPWAHLRGEIRIWEASFHVEAIAVHEVELLFENLKEKVLEYRPVQDVFCPYLIDKYDGLTRTFEVEQFETVQIEGRDYVLFVSPFAR